MTDSRDKLPYRETTICFIIYKGKVICDFVGNSYARLPGGGIDKGESPL